MLYDISVPLSPDCPVYLGDPNITITECSEIKAGANCNASILEFGSHSATHIDAPKHFINTGKTVSDISIERFVGEALVVDVRGCDAVSFRHVENLELSPGMNVLFKTDNGDALLKQEFKKDFVYLDFSAAEHLVRARVNLIGIDYLSIERFGSQKFEVHKLLLGNEIIILEGVRLTHVPAGKYRLFALPILIPGGNGSPVRAVLGDL